MSVNWIDHFDGLSNLEPEWRQTILDQARVLTIPSDTEIFAPDKPAENMIFLIDGTVRVQQISDEGREIVLYRMEAGQSCIMTASCLLGYQDYSAQGISETEIQAVIIPKSVFDEMIAQSAHFRNFIFSTFSMRLTELMVIINEVAFRRVDIRLAGKLLELAKNKTEIKTTHQQLSVELGTAREVISRQLQEFQRQGWVEPSRGTIKIIDKVALIALTTKRKG